MILFKKRTKSLILYVSIKRYFNKESFNQHQASYEGSSYNLNIWLEIDEFTSDNQQVLVVDDSAWCLLYDISMVFSSYAIEED